MLTFLNSAILLGLAAVSIPILIHFFTRQKSKIVYFSSLRFLQELQRRQIRRLKLRQILLLVLRALLVLALVLAFARPTLKSSDAASLESGAQLTAVIILDNTLSMGRLSEGRPLFDSAKVRALEVVSMLRRRDEVYLLYPQKPPRFAQSGASHSPGAVSELIEKTEISHAGTDFEAALIAADDIMLKSKNINKEVYLISDLRAPKPQQHADDAALFLAPDVKLFVLPVRPSENENLTIADISIGNQILEKGKVAEVSVQLRNSGTQELKNKLVHLFVNGKRVGQDVADIPGGAAANVLFRVVPQQTGFQSGYALLEDDALAEDNRRYFAFHIASRIPVLLVGNKPEDTRYLKLALRPQKDVASYIDITEISADRLNTVELAKFEAVILSNVPRFDAATVLKVQAFVKAGGGLMIFLGEDVDLRNYNDHLHARLRLPTITQTLNRSAQDQFLSLGKIDFSHPIFRGVFEEKKFVETPHVRFAVDISEKQPVDRIIEYSNGKPFLFETKLQSGRILYATTSLAQKWSDLTLKGFFVPLVNRSVFYLAGDASAESGQVVVGDELSFEADGAAGADLSVETPDGSRVRIKPEISRGHYLVRFSDTRLPGIYRLYDGQRQLEQWACNFDAEEPAGRQLTMADFGKMVEESQLVKIEEGASIGERLQQSRFGRELGHSILVVAFLLIVAETLLARESASQEPAKQEG